VAAPELFSRGGRARSYETRGSAGAHLVWEARSEGEERMKAPELNSVRRRGPGSRVRSGAVGHVTSLKPTSAGRCSPKLQLTWQCVDTYPTSYFDLEFICKVPGLQDARQLRWFTCDRISMHRLNSRRGHWSVATLHCTAWSPPLSLSSLCDGVAELIRQARGMSSSRRTWIALTVALATVRRLKLE
jgi:hypothetical protein